MKQSTLLLKGMVIIAISVAFVIASFLYSGIVYADPNFAAKWYPYEVAMAMMVVVLWYLLLKKDIPLHFGVKLNKDFFITLPLLLLPSLLLVYMLLTSDSIDSEKATLFLITCIAVGIAEEMIFRVAGYRVLLATGSSVKRSILLSALLFSLSHLTNMVAGQGIEIISQLITTFMLGVVFAYIYYKTESILYIIMIHLIWDYSIFINSSSPVAGANIMYYILILVYFTWAMIHIFKFKKQK